MVGYLASLPGIHDPKMEDGTTAFAIALARRDIKVLRILMDSQIPSDIDHQHLAQRAILELERNPQDCNNLLKEVLTRSNELPLQAFYIKEPAPRQGICEE